MSPSERPVIQFSGVAQSDTISPVKTMAKPMQAEKRSTPSSDKLFATACEHTPGGVNSSLRATLPNLVFKKALGATLTDADGNQYLDFHGAFGPALLGHNHPGVRRRVVEALESNLLAGAGTTELEIEVARKICQHVPSAQKVLLCNSGSEATYHALRVARAVTGRKKIIKFQGCYHGFHDAVLRNVSSPAEKIGKLDAGSAGMSREVLQNTLVCDYNRLESVEAALAKHQGDVAAIILEPIAHNVGCLMPRHGFLEGLRELSTKHRTVLIFDEVITGFRHHIGGYQAIAGITPDLTTFAKAMANGFPIAAVCGKAEIMDHFKTRSGGDTYFSGTFNGNAASCAAALGTIEILEREPVHQRLFAMGDRLRSGLREIHERVGVPAVIAGFGSVFVTYFMEGKAAGPFVPQGKLRPALQPDADHRPALQQPETYSDLLANDAEKFIDYRRRLIDHGIFMMPANLKRAHLSYAHTDADVDRLLQTTEDILKEMRG
jgi:glutamate-1-semialdehyde 2,1-aminomutase